MSSRGEVRSGKPQSIQAERRQVAAQPKSPFDDLAEHVAIVIRFGRTLLHHV